MNDIDKNHLAAYAIKLAMQCYNTEKNLRWAFGSPERLYHEGILDATRVIITDLCGMLDMVVPDSRWLRPKEENPNDPEI